jgi:hypothetical protein
LIKITADHIAKITQVVEDLRFVGAPDSKKRKIPGRVIDKFRIGVIELTQRMLTEPLNFEMPHVNII